MHLSTSSQRGEGGGKVGWFDIFQKIAVKFPTPGQKCESKYNWNPPPGWNDLWSRARTKIQISLPLGQQDNSNALTPGQRDRSNPRPMSLHVMHLSIETPTNPPPHRGSMGHWWGLLRVLAPFCVRGGGGFVVFCCISFARGVGD